MLTARHKIKQNDTSLSPWSISFPLQCSEYNQGCTLASTERCCDLLAMVLGSVNIV